MHSLKTSLTISPVKRASRKLADCSLSKRAARGRHGFHAFQISASGLSQSSSLASFPQWETHVPCVKTFSYFTVSATSSEKPRRL